MTEPRSSDPILVVDDDESVRNLIAELLSEEGVPYVLAVDGRDALEDKIGAREYSLVITDLMMAEGDGLDVVHELAATRPDLPVVVMSALMDEAEIVSEVESEPNVIGWVRKPLDIDRLRELVHRTQLRD